MEEVIPSLASCLGALDSREAMRFDTLSFWEALAFWPRSVDAAMRKIEFWIDAKSTEVAADESVVICR